MDVEMRGRAETLDQRDGASGLGALEPRLLDQKGRATEWPCLPSRGRKCGNDPVDEAEMQVLEAHLRKHAYRAVQEIALNAALYHFHNRLDRLIRPEARARRHVLRPLTRATPLGGQ
jgi:hypothetical protein